LLATSTIHAEGPSDDELKSLGLDPAGPVASLKVSVPTFTDEKEREYHIGRNTPDDKNYYFRVVGKPYVFLAPKTLVSELVDADLTDKVLFRTDKSKIKALYLTGWKPKGPMAKPLSAILELQNGVWVAKEPAAAAVDPNQVLLILAAFESPKAYKAIGPEDPILKTNLGFDDTSHSFIAELDDKSSVSMLIGAEVPDKSGFYARVAGGTFIIAAGSLRSALEKSPLLAK